MHASPPVHHCHDRQHLHFRDVLKDTVKVKQRNPYHLPILAITLVPCSSDIFMTLTEFKDILNTHVRMITFLVIPTEMQAVSMSWTYGSFHP